MEDVQMQKYRQDTVLTNYYPLPRSLLKLDLPSTALLLYSILLDRATLSQKNGFTDPGGWVFVIYPIEHLAESLGVCPSVVKKHLKTLEDAGLIQRSRPSGNGASQIYLYLPADSEKKPPQEHNNAIKGAGTGLATGKKSATNNRRYQQRLTDNYYQYGEDESL